MLFDTDHNHDDVTVSVLRGIWRSGISSTAKVHDALQIDKLDIGT